MLRHHTPTFIIEPFFNDLLQWLLRIVEKLSVKLSKNYQWNRRKSINEIIEKLSVTYEMWYNCTK